MRQFKDFGIKPSAEGLVGDKIKIDKILNQEIIIEKYRIKDSNYEKGNGKCLWLQLMYKDEQRVLFTGSGNLMDMIQKVPENGFPFATKITKDNGHYQFN